MAVSVDNIIIEVYSITGALVATFSNSTLSADDLIVNCSESRDGGLDSFSFTVPRDTEEPLFGQMECRIYVGGVWWYSGYAEVIPSPDQDEPIIEIAGLGFFHKLEEKEVDVSYTNQTLDFIIKDIANTYLGIELNVYYDVSKISVPSVSGITIEFKDKSLLEVFSSLSKIANKDYATQQYTWGVDKEKELYFSLISNDTLLHLFEGYQYQDPKVDKLESGLINSVLAYRTTLADPNVAEYVATYQDPTSISVNGLHQKKITFPDYADATTIENIVNSVIERNAVPLDRVELDNLVTDSLLPIGFYELSNRRDRYIVSVNEFEDISEWDLTNLSNTTASIATDQVFTGRTALKLSTGVGSAGEYMEYTLPAPAKYPDIFRLFVYLNDVNADITVKVIDSNNNEFDLDFDSSRGIQQWLKVFENISSVLTTRNLQVDNGTGDEDLIVDVNESTSGNLIVDKLEGAGVLDISRVQIIINNNNSSTIWIDSMATRSNTFFHRKLLLEQVEYELTKSRIAKCSFGERVDSLIDEIKSNVKEGNIALSIFSKQ